MAEFDKSSVIKASFLSNGEMNCLISIIPEDIEHGYKRRLYFERPSDNNKHKSFYYVPLFPNSPVQSNDIILPEQVVFITIDKFTEYAWRFGDVFPYELLVNDPYTSRILSGQLNRDEYFTELLEEKKRKEEEKKQEVLKKQEEKRLNQKESWINDKLPVIIGIIVGLLFLFGIVYLVVTKQNSEAFEFLSYLLFALFLIPLLLLCERIWEKLNAKSVCICIALSIVLSMVSIQGINNLVNGDVHKEHYHNTSSSSSNGVVGGIDPFPDDNVDVYVTRYGDCYHSTSNCYEIKKSKLISKVSKKKAIRRGYVPCSACY